MPVLEDRSARLAAADERINRAQADAVERHATKDPGMRCILMRANVVCHPESEPQKKIALDTEQDSTPHLSVPYGGSSASGAQPSITTSTDQNTRTGDVTREARTGPTQDVARASSSDDIGDDVVMREDKQSRTPEFVAVRRQEKNHNEEGTTWSQRCGIERHRATHSKKNLGEHNAVGAPRCGYHTRGPGRIS